LLTLRATMESDSIPALAMVVPAKMDIIWKLLVMSAGGPFLPTGKA
jgi:hypothetical protein